MVAVDDTPNLQAEPGIATLIEPELLLANDLIRISVSLAKVSRWCRFTAITVELVDGKIIFTPTSIISVMLHLIILLKIQKDFRHSHDGGMGRTPPVVIDDNLSFTDTANDGSLLISLSTFSRIDMSSAAHPRDWAFIQSKIL